MSGMCDGRVCIVTGAGRGIGREYALMLADHGALVVVNDIGAARDGTGIDQGPAQQVVDEIVDKGGHAVANTTMSATSTWPSIWYVRRSTNSGAWMSSSTTQESCATARSRT